jgi:hypothetical protein
MLDNRGQMRTVEAFLAILLLFSALTVATLTSPTSNPSYPNALTTVAMQTLTSMDNDGQLGQLIYDGNWTALADALATLLPIGVGYNLTVYDENAQPINSIPISNGIILDQRVVSIQHPCASPTPQSCYYLLRLQLAIAT